jgi:3-hydroxyacyl-[acyl-carrier-protein] dehydratase
MTADAPPPAPVARLDSHAVLALLAHRYPFLLVDRVDVLERGRRVVGAHRVTGAEWASGESMGRASGGVVLGTADGMSGLLVVEALAQTSGALLLDLLDDTGSAVGYFAAIERVRLRGPARPGDELRLTVTLRSFRRGVARLRGVADVADRLVATADFTTILRARAA